MKTKHPKKYTLIRRIYAWIGFAVLVIGFPIAIAATIKAIINNII